MGGGRWQGETLAVPPLAQPQNQISQQFDTRLRLPAAALC